MFALIFLLSSVCGSKANTAGSSAGKEICQVPNYCITLREGDITAEAGLCVVIPCSFTTAPNFIASKIIWYQCQTPKVRCPESDRIFNSSDQSIGAESGFRGRVSLLESDVSQKNCSIIIKDLRESDSGFYQLRVESLTIGFTFNDKASLSVKGLTQKPTVKIPPLTEGQQTRLSCTAPGLCSGSVPEITWMWRGGGQNESSIRGQVTDFKTENLRHTSSLTFTPSAELHGTNITCKVSFQHSISTERTETLNVSYIKKPVIKGEERVKLGDALNLSCSVDSFPPSVVTWTKLGSNQTLEEETRRAELIIPIMTAEDGGKYICTASHHITNQTTHTEVQVKISPRIFNSSACEVQSEVLTCVCLSQGFPLPTIEWPLLKNHTHYSFTTRVTNNTVSSSISVSVQHHSYTTAVCVSRNKAGPVEEELKVIKRNETELEEEDLSQGLLESLKLPQVILAFLIGLLLSAIICCSVQKCHRKKQRSSGNVSTENLVMMDVDPAAVNGGRHGQDRAEGGAEGGAEPREVEYSNINFDLLKRGRPIGAERNQETSEYAEIKTAERTQDKDGEDGEMEEEGNQEEEEEERKDNVEEKEEEALYSNVKDLMKEL